MSGLAINELRLVRQNREGMKGLLIQGPHTLVIVGVKTLAHEPTDLIATNTFMALHQ